MTSISSCPFPSEKAQVVTCLVINYFCNSHSKFILQCTAEEKKNEGEKKRKRKDRFYMLRRVLQTEAINWHCTACTRKSGDVKWGLVFENVGNRQGLKDWCCSRVGGEHSDLILGPEQLPYCKLRWRPCFSLSSHSQGWGSFALCWRQPRSL